MECRRRRLKKTSMYSKTSVRSSALVGHGRPWMSSFLKGGEEALGHGVIEAVAAAAHRLGDAGGAGLLSEGQSDELPGLKGSSQHRVLGKRTVAGRPTALES